MLDEGVAVLRKHHERELSLCDCVSAALLRRRKVRRVFAFDDDFQALGFGVLPDAGEEEVFP